MKSNSLHKTKGMLMNSRKDILKPEFGQLAESFRAIVVDKIGEIELLDIDPKKWAKKHGLTFYDKECKNCGRTQRLDQPARFNGYVGFIKDGCECGSTMVRCYFVPESEKEIKFWRSFFDLL